MAEQMLSPQLVAIRRQFLECRANMVDTRKNVAVNSSELGFHIVLYRSNSYATRINLFYCRGWQDTENAR